MKIKVKLTEALGIKIGNLWDIFSDKKWVARVSYEGNTLVIIKGKLPISKSKIEKLIELTC